MPFVQSKSLYLEFYEVKGSELIMANLSTAPPRIMQKFNLAIDQATNGELNELHGAVVVSGSKVIGKGYNSLEKSFDLRFGTLRHAEMSALKFMYNERCQKVVPTKVQEG